MKKIIAKGLYLSILLATATSLIVVAFVAAFHAGRAHAGR